jgi:hypothetical protein
VILCKLFYYVSYTSATYLPIVLTLASVDRLLLSSQNIDTRLYSSKRLGYFSISTSGFIWSIFSLHILIKVNIVEIFPRYSICYYDRSEFYVNFFLYSTLAISGIIPFLLIILSVLTFKNARRIRAIPRQQRREIRTMNKKDFQLLRCLYVHNIVYIIFSILIVVSIVYSETLKYETSTRMEQAVSNFLSNIGGFLYYIPYCTSFFIFANVSKAFRLELKRLAYNIRRKDLAAVRKQEPTRNNIELNNVVSTIVIQT